jgi:hypothetical protein
MTDVIHCTPETPWDGVRPTIHHRVIHHDVEEEGEQIDGYPGGDIVTMRCKVCWHRWRMELPQ